MVADVHYGAMPEVKLIYRINTGSGVLAARGVWFCSAMTSAPVVGASKAQAIITVPPIMDLGDFVTLPLGVVVILVFRTR